MKKMPIVLVATIMLQACSWVEIIVCEGAPSKLRKEREAAAAPRR